MDGIVVVDDVDGSALLVELPVRVRTCVQRLVLVVDSVCNAFGSCDVLLVEEYGTVGFCGDGLAAEYPLLRVSEAFDKRVALEVYVLVAGVVDFDPGGVIALVVEPRKVERGNFGEEEDGGVRDVEFLFRNGDFFFSLRGGGIVGTGLECEPKPEGERRG